LWVIPKAAVSIQQSALGIQSRNFAGPDVPILSLAWFGTPRAREPEYFCAMFTMFTRPFAFRDLGGELLTFHMFTMFTKFTESKSLVTNRLVAGQPECRTVSASAFSVVKDLIPLPPGRMDRRFLRSRL
jgi:hypothetical protein